MWLLGTGAGLYLTAQVGITGFVALFLHEHRHVSREAAGAVLAVIDVLAVAARIGSGLLSDRLGSRLRPLRAIGITLALATACVAAATDAPLVLLVPLFLVAGMLSMSWNGLAYAAAAEAAGAARTGRRSASSRRCSAWSSPAHRPSSPLSPRTTGGSPSCWPPRVRRSAS